MPAKMQFCYDLIPLPREFYARPVLNVASDCLGKLLVHHLKGETLIAKIVEVEAYRGPADRAAHSYQGRRTARTEVMYGKAGMAYVFFVYGMYHQFNVVTGQLDEPEAVLIRAVEPLAGQTLMASHRGHPRNNRLLTNGPGKLCQAFGIDQRHYGADLCSPPLCLAQGPKPRTILSSPRVGVDYAGKWAALPWRWFDANSPFVSARGGRKRRA
jgi:DNA-3-methyladenine glycosylase